MADPAHGVGGTQKELDGGGQGPVLRFAKPPASTTRTRLASAGYLYDPDSQSWQAEEDTPQARQLAADLGRYLVPMTAPRPSAPTAPSAGGTSPTARAVQLPPTDPRLRPVLEQLQQLIPSRIWRTWFGERVSLTVEGDGAVLWVGGEHSADFIRQRYVDQLRQAFVAALGRAPARLECRCAGREAAAA